MTLEGKPHVLAEAVGDQIEIAWSRTVTLRLGSLDVMLEPVETAPYPSSPGVSEQELRRLHEDCHLVAIVLSAVMKPVDRRAHGRSQNRASLDELG